jgi:hypothetical protein
MKFNPNRDTVLVTDRDTGPEDWEMIPVQDLNVFYNPKAVDEADIVRIVEDFSNSSGKLMEKIAFFDTALDRELRNS